LPFRAGFQPADAENLKPQSSKARQTTRRSPGRSMPHIFSRL
jgi:hypothetical protein